MNYGTPDNFAPPIRLKPFWMRFKNASAFTTIFGTIYCPTEADADRLKRPRTTRDMAVLIHEKVHAYRQGKSLSWHARYAFDRAFRWEEERVAYEWEFAYVRVHAGGMTAYSDLDALCDFISGEAYNHMIDRAACAAWLKTQWLAT